MVSDMDFRIRPTGVSYGSVAPLRIGNDKRDLKLASGCSAHPTGAEQAIRPEHLVQSLSQSTDTAATRRG
ncbi:hypothetical protein GCM10023328_17030 [Modestobacter marinus]|uniref:Uncharacterized protein n=1 Tax=Modestobacter marinus TaxID=477641 RepID=A0A846LLI1_9ACTN|nr:hypothetical protein [Modestobacter marinus]NIH68241.1 hypothetical protein [Modestobacter marinus]GGL79292.1 hypothetical protein GCM10011589_39290 [Modestobacter marinus]